MFSYSMKSSEVKIEVIETMQLNLNYEVAIDKNDNEYETLIKTH